MIAFILSSAIAFALYELLAFIQWPPTQSRFRFYGNTTLFYTAGTANAVFNVLRTLIVLLLLLFVLAVHNFATPLDVLTRYEVNVVLGFVFGPLAAMWVNGIVLRDVREGLSAGQILATFGLMLLFFLGATGDQTSKLIGRYASSLSSVKLAGAELSFTSKETSDRSPLTGAGVAGATGIAAPNVPVTGRSQGLQNLAALDKIIERDEGYFTTLFPPKGQQIPVADLELADQFAKMGVAPALSCLFAWFQNTGDPRPIEHYLTAYAAGLSQLDVLDRQANAPASPPIPSDKRNEDKLRRLKQIIFDFVRNGLTMAQEVALSTSNKEVLEACKPWFDVYDPANAAKNDSADNKKSDDKDPPTVGDKLAQQDDRKISTCGADCLGKQLASFPTINALGKDPASARISELIKKLDFGTPFGGHPRWLNSLPYLAMARASVMAQLDAHEAAATILDDWLRQRRQLTKERQDLFDRRPLLLLKDEWLALRVRFISVVYVEEWLEQPASSAGNEVRKEHLENLRILRNGFRERLLKADFFKQLDKICETKCEPTFRRPSECSSDESSARLKLFRSLYSSYVSVEYQYLHRLLESPDYEDHFVDDADEQAARLVNLDLSCGAASPQPEVLYAQSLLGFVENAVSYVRVRAAKQDAATLGKRLDQAERAARFGLGIIKTIVAEDEERGGKLYLERITPSFAAQTQDQLGAQLKKIDQARKSLE